jgi:zinc D-Ala-D-Ala carboxypeptidase
MPNFGKWFKPHEFDSPDLPGSSINMKQELLDKLNAAREIAGIPFKINSGFRTVAKNKAEKGKSDSAHLTGFAADVDLTKDSRQRFLILHALFAVGFTRFGIGDGFIHVDCDPTKDPKVAWIY